MSYVEISGDDSNSEAESSDSAFKLSSEETSGSDSDFEYEQPEQAVIFRLNKKSKHVASSQSSRLSSSKRPKKLTPHQVRALRRLGDTLTPGMSDPAPSPISSMPDITFIMEDDDEGDSASMKQRKSRRASKSSTSSTGRNRKSSSTSKRPAPRKETGSKGKSPRVAKRVTA